MRKKFVAEPFAFVRSFYQPRDINKLNGCRDCLFGVGEFGKFCQPRVRHGNHTHIGVNSGKRIVGCIYLFFGERLKQSRLTNIWKAHNADL